MSVSQILPTDPPLEAQGLEGTATALAAVPRSGPPEREAAFQQRVPGVLALTADWRPGAARTCVVLREEFEAHYSLSGVYALLHRLGCPIWSSSPASRQRCCCPSGF